MVREGLPEVTPLQGREVERDGVCEDLGDELSVLKGQAGGLGCSPDRGGGRGGVAGREQRDTQQQRSQ